MSEISFNHFSEIAAALTPLLNTAVTQTALNIVKVYEGTAPRDTGEMAESGYVVSTTANTYPAGSPSREDAYYLPQVDTPSDETTAIAAIAMNYAEFPELGTRYQAPQPAFFPAVDASVPFFENELSNVVDELEAKFG